VAAVGAYDLGKKRKRNGEGGNEWKGRRHEGRDGELKALKGNCTIEERRGKTAGRRA